MNDADGDDLDALQYDIRQRHDLLAAILRVVAPAPARLLDLGAGPEGLSRRLLPAGYDIVLADVARHGRADVVELEAGQRLPFADSSFDAVICMDVLEHVEPGERHGLVDELARVAAGAVVLAFPRANVAVREAEQLLARLFEAGTGVPHVFLAEHVRYGLPDAEAIAGRLRARGLGVAMHGNAPLGDWLLCTAVDAMFAMVAGDCAAKGAFNRSVNVAPAAPVPGQCYRVFVTAVRDAALLRRLTAAIGPGGLADGTAAATPATVAASAAALADLMSLSVARLRNGLAAKDATIEGLQAALVAKDHHIAKLEALVQEVARRRAGRQADA